MTLAGFNDGQTTTGDLIGMLFLTLLFLALVVWVISDGIRRP